MGKNPPLKSPQAAYRDAIARAQRQAKVEFHQEQITPEQQQKWGSLDVTPYSPARAQINVSKAFEQLDGVINGTLKTGRSPTQAVHALYKQYEDALGTLDRGQKRFPDYWDRMPPDTREYLQGVSGENKIPESYWTEKLQDG